MPYYVINDNNGIVATETVRPAEGAYPGRRVVFSTKNYNDVLPAAAVAADITGGIVSIAQSAVGVKLTDLTTTQISVCPPSPREWGCVLKANRPATDRAVMLARKHYFIRPRTSPRRFCKSAIRLR